MHNETGVMQKIIGEFDRLREGVKLLERVMNMGTSALPAKLRWEIKDYFDKDESE